MEKCIKFPKIKYIVKRNGEINFRLLDYLEKKYGGDAFLKGVSPYSCSTYFRVGDKIIRVSDHDGYNADYYETYSHLTTFIFSKKEITGIGKTY
jgi:hypothetical protein